MTPEQFAELIKSLQNIDTSLGFIFLALMFILLFKNCSK